jgi:hypothetical protein
MGPEWGPLSLASKLRSYLIEVAAPVEKGENTAVGDPLRRQRDTVRKSWHLLRRQAAVARSVYFARGLGPRSSAFHVDVKKGEELRGLGVGHDRQDATLCLALGKMYRMANA